MAKAKPAPASTGPLQGFLTDQHLASLGLTADIAESVLADAGAVYSQISASPYITRDQLTEWAASAWSERPVDRLNAALGFLQTAKKIAPLAP